MVKDTTQNPIEYFRLKAAETKSGASLSNMSRAIDSLARYAAGADIDFDSFDDAFLGEWVARQFFDGYFSKTIAYNISKIAALYNKAVAEGLAQPSAAFAEILAKVKGCGSIFDGKSHGDTFQKLRRMAMEDLSLMPSVLLAKDIIMFGLINGGMPLSRLASFKKDEYQGDDPCAKEIVSRYSRPKNKYLFPLNQSHLTPKQSLRTFSVLVGELLRRFGIKPTEDLDGMLADAWCDAAMSCGFSASDVAASVAYQRLMTPLTYFVSPSSISEGRIADIRGRVANALTENPARWFAMHLRPHVGFSELSARLKEKKIELEDIYYPMEEIYRRVGKRMVFETQPVIQWLVFFRSRVNELNALFAQIGDLAWGYRHSRDAKSPYAAIGNYEIRAYQLAIGTLSPATEMLPDEDVKFNAGDHLVVLGGLMDGRQAIFISEKKQPGDKPGGKTVYRVKLSGGTSANWIVDWDPRLVKKIPAPTPAQ
ncbi:MAG: hypothetical protein NC102_05260 [Clostridium sp.]|nr:hypothetical protein [Clostridium sp.]